MTPYPENLIDSSPTLVPCCPKCGIQFEHVTFTCPMDGTLLVEGLQPGITVADKYTFISVIGAGGMGVIVKAGSASNDTPVAIKMLLSTSSRHDKQRFEQEAKAASMLIHENIILVREYGIAVDGYPFMVMDYLEGRDLAEVIAKNGSLSTSDTLGIFEQLCDAVSYAHSKGVVHRDIKPGNIMLLPDEKKSTKVKLLDFGIAKIVQPEGSLEKSLTATGQIFGSPLYMSPEQALGKKVDNRADIYSAGCVLYHCLTGAPPLEGSTALETLFKHVNDQPLDIAQASLGKQFPTGLQEVVARTLAKNPADRYQSFDEFKKELQGAILGSSESLIPQMMTEPKKGNSSALITGATVALSLVVAVCISVIGNLKSSTNSANSFKSAGSITQPETSSTTRKAAFDAADDIEDVLLSKATRPEDFGKRSIGFALRTNHGSRFELNQKSVSDKDISYLISRVADEMCHPKAMCLDNSSVSNTGMEMLALANFQLDTLRIENTPMTGAAMGSVGRIRSLQELSISAMKECTPQNTNNLKNLKKLWFLRLINSDITDDGLQFLTSLKSLKELCLESNHRMGNGALAYIAKLPNLTSLSCGWTKIDDNGLKIIGQMRSIRWLRIEGPNFHDEGIEAIASLHSLKLLDLNKTLITDKSLVAIERLHRLTELDLAGCLGIHQQAIDSLQRKLPFCRIVRQRQPSTKTSLEFIGDPSRP